MADRDDDAPDINWRLTTWEGARRETLRRWSELPLHRVIAALEEMEELSRALASAPDPSKRQGGAE
jgi:hypothetical protein